MKEANQLQELINSDPILSINERTLSSFARLSTFGQIIDLIDGKKVEGIEGENTDYDKIFDQEFLEAAKILVEKIDYILGEDIKEFRDANIGLITKKAGKKLIETGELENYIVGNYIKKISYKVSNIRLRHERYKKHLENRELKIKNSFDNLTGLLTNESINKYIKRAINEVKVGEEYYGVALIDIDFFKVINDEFGHVEGDIVLKEISNMFIENFRETDKISRWGGEEFLLLLKGGDIENQSKKLDEFRKIVQKTLLQRVNKKIKNETCKLEKIELKQITISAGITDLEKSDTITSVTKRSDEAMYNSKAGGRNRVTKLGFVKEIKKI